MTEDLADPVALEPAAVTFCGATGGRPFLNEVSISEGRGMVEKLQSGQIDAPNVDDAWISLPGGPAGDIPVRIVRPRGSSGMTPVILYLHGGGWVFGSAKTHDRLVRELCAGTGATVVFPEYHLSPEVRFPVAIKEAYLTARWITVAGHQYGFDASRMTVAGDCVGGTIAIAQTLLSKALGDAGFRAQALFYPATDAAFETQSYGQFADNFWLRRSTMQWFWDQYTTDLDERAHIIASPRRASTEELQNLPPALIITAEADVLRDEGEAYGRHLRAADVDVTAVRCQGVTHDFMMLNELRDTNGAEIAITQAIRFLSAAMAK